MLNLSQNYNLRANQLLKNIMENDHKLEQKMKKYFADVKLKKDQTLQQKSKKCQVNAQCSVQNQEETYQFDFQIKSAQHMGSLSNQVYKVQMKKGRTVILKHYLQVLKQFVKRDLQHLILDKMTKNKQYPYIFYKDEYCRIQDYVNGYSIQRKQLTPKLLKTIVQTLSSFSITYKDVIPQNHQKAKERKINNLFKTFNQIYQLKRKQNPNLIAKVQKWVDSILKNNEILQNLENILKDQKMILSHNDSNLSNILVLNQKLQQNENPKIQLLDYQFVNYNYIGYDIGNLLNQIATDYGGAYDQGVHQHQSKFQIRQDWQVQKDLMKEMIQVYFNNLELKSGSQQLKNISMEKRQRSVKIGRLLSHLYWLFIGVKQIDDPNIDLDMIYYVQRRYQQFMKLYKQIV